MKTGKKIFDCPKLTRPFQQEILDLMLTLKTIKAAQSQFGFSQNDENSSFSLYRGTISTCERGHRLLIPSLGPRTDARIHRWKTLLQISVFDRLSFPPFRRSVSPLLTSPQTSIKVGNETFKLKTDQQRPLLILMLGQESKMPFSPLYRPDRGEKGVISVDA